MAYLGSWKIDDQLVFFANLHHPTGASAVDHDAGGSPIFRIYENNASPDIASGFMYQLHGACTIGFYSSCITLSTGNGFDQGGRYSIYMAASVASTTGTLHHNFQVGAEVRSACIAASAINASALAANSLHAAAISSSTFTNAKFANNFLTAGLVSSSALTNAKFGNNFLTNSLINASAITASTLAANAIHAAAVSSSTLTNAKFANTFLTTSLIAGSALNNTIITQNALDQAWTSATRSLTASAITASTFIAGAIDAVAFAQAAADKVWTSTTRTLTASAITASTFAASGIDAVAIDDDFGQRLADHILRRSGSGVETSSYGDGLGFRSLYGAVAKHVNKLDATDGATASVFQTDDSTVLGTQTITTCTNASPIVQLDTV